MPLLIRNLFFAILQPGVVTLLLPYLILRAAGRDVLPISFDILHLAAFAVMLAGAVVLISCIVRFPAEGQGTISPLDPTKKLVVRGLYRYSRNPMYVGAMLLLIGEALFWRSGWLAVYSAAVFIAFHLFVLLHEEPRLTREFGPEYADYRSQVRRWL